MMEATVHLLFAFDVGYEIDLERARGLLAGEAAGLTRRRRTPESIRYRPAPLRLAADAAGLALPVPMETTGPPSAELSLFDFGAVSLAIRHRVRGMPEQFLALAAALADPAPLNAAARLALAPWLDRLRPLVEDFEPSDLSEEFVVFQFGAADDQWLARNAGWIAGLVRLDDQPLSSAEIHEATRLNLAYAANDLVVLDWAAGVVADREADDTLQVIEFANVQLLEFRLIDDRLDDRLEAAYRQIRQGRRRAPWHVFSDPGAAAVRHVRELELEATSLIERADNALKLIGDQYLARIYALASARFHLAEWQQSIRRKLDTVGDVFDLLTGQAGARRLEVLEVIVILLIAFEIVLAFFRH